MRMKLTNKAVMDSYNKRGKLDKVMAFDLDQASGKVEREDEQMLNAIVLKLSDDLIQELVVKRGFPKRALEGARKDGFGYCRERDSLISFLWDIEYLEGEMVCIREEVKF